MSDKTLITISRMYGSGGRAIGRLLAEKLGIGFVDKDRLREISEGATYTKEEARRRLIEENTSAYKNITSAMGVVSRGEKKEYEEHKRIIRELAEKGSYVFVERCADYILSDFPEVISIFIYDSIENRVKRTSEEQAISIDEARLWVATTDSNRKMVYNRQTGRIWGDTANYHLSIDAGKLSLQSAVELILTYIRLREEGEEK